MTEILPDGNIQGSLYNVYNYAQHNGRDMRACGIYKGCGPSARLELPGPPDDFSRNVPGNAGWRGDGARRRSGIAAPS